MKIKILHLIKSLGRGGAEMLLPETISQHNKEKYAFHVIYFLPWKDQMVKEIEMVGGQVICLNKSNNWKILTSVTQVVAYCREHKIDIIHAHLPWAGFLARRVGRKTAIPVVYSEHNKQERYHFLTKWINKFTFHNQSMAIAVSEDVKISIQKNINPKIPVQTVLNGVNTIKFNPTHFSGVEIRNQLKIKENTVVIGTVAVFRTQKRLDIWMEVAGKLSKLYDNLFFIMLGDGPMESIIMQKIQDHHLADRVHLPGRLEEVRPWLAAMDIYMMTSEFEGLPIALLEAMSMQLPVITTKAGGIEEVIENEKEGFMVAVDDPYQLIPFASLLIEDKTKRVEMGEYARTKVKKEFSMSRMVRELEDVYSHLMK